MDPGLLGNKTIAAGKSLYKILPYSPFSTFEHQDIKQSRMVSSGATLENKGVYRSSYILLS